MRRLFHPAWQARRRHIASTHLMENLFPDFGVLTRVSTLTVSSTRPPVFSLALWQLTNTD